MWVKIKNAGNDYQYGVLAIWLQHGVLVLMIIVRFTHHCEHIHDEM
jgi:hypothetical protein